MLSIILGQGMAAIGSNLAGPIGGFVGMGIGKTYGKFLDHKLIHGTQSKIIDGARINDLNVQTSAYGKTIPIIYGKVRIAGNIIWSLPIKELKTTTKSTKGKYSNIEIINNGYSYFVTLAIALAEGEIDYISRAWADTKILDLSLERYRFYNGSQDQLPDPIIEANIGIGKTPAYRGLSYIVIENFPIAEFGNRIPNFTFEVNRVIKNNNKNSIKYFNKSVVLGPGYGEHTYDTDIINKIHTSIYGKKHMHANPRTPVNMNNSKNLPDIIYSIEQLEDSFSKINWISPEVNWFLEQDKLIPCVEYKNAATEQEWKVDNFTRENATIVPQELLEKGIGGTASDISIIKFIKYAKTKNYKILFRPNYIRNENYTLNLVCYRNFLIHYAKLLKGNIDGFLIGIDIKNLNENLVDNLIKIAQELREILGPQVKLSYASSWKDYNKPILDKLWSNQNIDFIGIENFAEIDTDLTFNKLSKPIWFTALGFKSSYKLQSNFKEQQQNLLKAYRKWQKSNTIENIFLYYWDSRPLPYTQGLEEIWKDSKEYDYNFAVNGKLEINNLYDIISDLLSKANFPITKTKIDLPSVLEGFVINDDYNVIEIVETIKQAFNFNIIQKDEKLCLQYDDLTKIIKINESELVKDSDKTVFEMIRIPDYELANKVEISFLDKNKNYQFNVQTAVNYYKSNEKKLSVLLPFIFDIKSAKDLAENILSQIWQERFLYSFTLPTKYIYLKVADILEIKLSNNKHLIKIDQISLQEGKKFKILGHSLCKTL